MLRLTTRHENGDCYISPDHIVVLRQCEKGTLVWVGKHCIEVTEPALAIALAIEDYRAFGMRGVRHYAGAALSAAEMWPLVLLPEPQTDVEDE